MPLPTPLSRRDKSAHKNAFGHVLILAGSARMLGAGCMAALAALRSGAGLVTLGVPKSLNTAAQTKCANMVMTWPLPEAKGGTFAAAAFKLIREKFGSYQAIAVGPGLSVTPATRALVRNIVTHSPVPLVIDADALNVLGEEGARGQGSGAGLLKDGAPKILTPHPGEMARLTGKPKKYIEANRRKVVEDFVKTHNCVLLLKGHQTLVGTLAPGPRALTPEVVIYTNRTGNAGMATAGSGDVLTGMIAAFLGQGVGAFEAAKWGAYMHGKAGDMAARKLGEASLTAADIIEFIPKALKNCSQKSP